MDKIAVKDFATEPLNRAQIFRALLAIENQINRGADGYLFPVKRLTSADSPYTVNSNDSILICNTSGGSITINLMPALEWEQKLLIVKKISASNTVTVDADGTDLIDGAATDAFTTNYTARRYVSEGGAIHIV